MIYLNELHTTDLVGRGFLIHYYKKMTHLLLIARLEDYLFTDLRLGSYPSLKHAMTYLKLC